MRERSPAGREPPLLATLLGLFPRDGLEPRDIELVEASKVPEPYHRLLVHREHMTVTLEEHHGKKVHLVVLDRKRDGDEYSRRLILRAGPAGKVVLAGIMRIQLQVCGEAARERIISESAPLGRILMEDGILRSIQPMGYLRLRMGKDLRWLFEAPPGGAEFTYGRIAGIVCSRRGRPGESPVPGLVPAVELLEIVSPEEGQG